MEDLVSIIIPAYNVENYIEECVFSILDQTYNNYEIIIVDDGSDDNTLEICDKLKKKSFKIKVYTQENQGVSVARNNGMKYAKGKYYIFVDADDIVSQYYIQRLISLVKNYDMAIIGYTIHRKEMNTYLNSYADIVNSKTVIDEILKGTGYDGYLWNKIFKSSVIKKNNLQFKCNVTIWEDLYFVLEYLSYSLKVNIVKDKLYYYRCREGSAVHELGIDKYRSKYEIMKEIKNNILNGSEEGKQRILYLYYETLFSYVNKAFENNEDVNETIVMIKNTSIKEVLSEKKIVFILKLFYLRVKAIFLSMIKRNI